MEFEVKKPLRGTAAMSQEDAARVQSLGGQAISANREHMRELGRKGGQTVSQNKQHMSEIGRKGGSAGKGGSKPRKERGQ